MISRFQWKATKSQCKETTPIANCFEQFEKNPENRPEILTKLLNALSSIPPSSIESERSFSTTSFYGTKIRSRLQDDVLSALVFLKHYFNKQRQQ